MSGKSSLALLAACVCVSLLCTPAVAQRIVCTIGIVLHGGTSDPSTVVTDDPAGEALAYTIYAVDKDQPVSGGQLEFDTTLWVAEHEITSMPTHSITLQGDDAATGKRTWSVSGVVPFNPGPADVIYTDRFKFDDGDTAAPPHPQFIFANDPRSNWYSKTVIAKAVQQQGGGGPDG
jgi:hypothetical protein